MNQGQGTVLRSGGVIDSSLEIESPADPDMAQANSGKLRLSEIKESYERRINELHQEFSQLKDLMMAIVSKNNNESQPSSSKGPSKPAQQHGFYTRENITTNVDEVSHSHLNASETIFKRIIKPFAPFQ